MSDSLGERRALLLLDLTPDTVRPAGSFGQIMDPSTDFDGLIARIRTAIDNARARGDELVWVVPGVEFMVRMSGRTPAPEASRPDPLVGHPLNGEPLVLKEEIGGFEGSTLDSILRGRGVGTISLVGVATQYVIALTAKEGAALGYEVEILTDGCADVDAATHENTLAELRDIATFTTIES